MPGQDSGKGAAEKRGGTEEREGSRARTEGKDTERRVGTEAEEKVEQG